MCIIRQLFLKNCSVKGLQVDEFMCPFGSQLSCLPIPVQTRWLRNVMGGY